MPSTYTPRTQNSQLMSYGNKQSTWDKNPQIQQKKHQKKLKENKQRTKKKKNR